MARTRCRVIQQRDRLQGKATLGVRPEDIVLTTAVNEPAGIAYRVTLVEHMGAQNIFILHAGKQQFTATTDADFYWPQVRTLRFVEQCQTAFLCRPNRQKFNVVTKRTAAAQIATRSQDK